MKQTIQSVIIWVMGTLLIVLLFLVMVFLTIIFYPFDKKRKIVHAQCFWWADAITALNPYWDVKVSGLENIDHHKKYVVVLNHQSLADIVLMYKTKMQFKWVAKDSLFKVFCDRMLNLIVRLLFGINLKDTNCALKLAKGELIRKVNIEAKGFPTPSEIIIKLHAQGAKLGEVGITHLERKVGISKLKPIKTAINMFKFLAQQARVIDSRLFRISEDKILLN